MTNEEPRRQRRHVPKYLPILSLMLVFSTLGLLLKMYMDRPSDKRERQIAAFSTVLEEIPQRYVGDVSADELYTAAMKGMLNALSDPYSTYLSPVQLENSNFQTQGEFGGIGVMVSPRNGGGIIVNVQENGPAEKADLQEGDIIVGVDGHDTGSLPFDQFISLVRGKVGTEVTLRVKEVDSPEERQVTLVREMIDMESVNWRWADDSIGYVQVRQFDEGVTGRVREAIREMQGEKELKAILIDVRGNTGGLLDEAVAMCDLFVESDVILKLSSRIKTEEVVFEATPQTVLPVDVPLGVLVDQRSASASEVFAGAMKQLERGQIIGAQTFGKGAVNRTMPLPDGSGMVLTVAEYTVGGTKSIEGEGVEPDIEVGTVPLPDIEMSPAEGREWLEKFREAQRDQYERAVQYLKTRIEGEEMGQEAGGD